MDGSHLVIMNHAYKHGLTEEEIRFTWNNSLVKFSRSHDSHGEVIVAFGPPDGTALVVGIKDCVAVLGRVEEPYIFIFHASRPPVPTLIQELEEWKRGNYEY